SRGYSEHTQWLVDQEVAALLTKAETRARDLLTSHRQALTRLTAALLEQETVTGDQVRALAQAASPAAADGQPASARLGLSGPAADHDGEQPFLLSKLVDSAQSIPLGAKPCDTRESSSPASAWPPRPPSAAVSPPPRRPARLPVARPRRASKPRLPSAPRRQPSEVRPRPSWSTVRACRCTTTSPTRRRSRWSPVGWRRCGRR